MVESAGAKSGTCWMGTPSGYDSALGSLPPDRQSPTPDAREDQDGDQYRGRNPPPTRGGHVGLITRWSRGVILLVGFGHPLTSI